MVEVPRLDTPRLVLRAFTASDVDPYVRMMADPEVTRFLGEGRPLDRGIDRGGSAPRSGAYAEHRLYGAPTDVYTYPISG